MNEQIQKAFSKNNSRFASVNTYRKNAYEQLDGYYTAAKKALENNYKTLSDAQEKIVSAALAEKGEKTAEANSAFLQSEKGAYSDLMSQKSSVGTTAEKLHAANLDGSGYEKTLAAEGVSDYAKSLEGARGALSESIKKYESEYITALTNGENEQARLSYKLSQDGAELENEIMSLLQKIDETAAQNEQKLAALEADNAASRAADNNKYEIQRLTLLNQKK